MPDLGAINWLAVVVAIVVAQVVGFLWYGPLFSKQWMAALGRTEEDIRAEGPGPAIFIGIVHSVLIAIALAILLTMSDTPDLVSGIKLALLTIVAFGIATVVTQGTYENRPTVTTWLYSGYLLVSTVAMGAILGAWQS